MKLVSIWPSPWDYRLRDGIFESGFSIRGSFKRAYNLWRERAAKVGFSLHTWDMRPVEEAKVLWFINLTKTKKEFMDIKKKYPTAVTVLQINESPLLAPYMFHEENQRLFDYVVTYNAHGINKSGHIHYHLPITIEKVDGNMPFSERRHVCIINSNRVEGWFGIRQNGIAGLPGIGSAFNGWKICLNDLFVNHNNGLYQDRRRLCRNAEKIPGLHFDIYGYGWSGEQISWFPLYPNKPYSRLVQKRIEDKIKVASKYRFNIAYENYRGNLGYIDIKIFDSIMAGSVPVYLGEERITDYVPEECFVDARKFKSQRHLLEYLRDCPEEEWKRMRDAGQDFIRSDKIKPFTDEAFAERMVEVLKIIDRNGRVTNGG